MTNIVNLLELEKKLIEELKNTQTYKKLQAVRLLLNAEKVYSFLSPMDELPVAVQLKTVLNEERNNIVNIVINHFKETNNNPLLLGDIYYKVLIPKGIVIEGSKPTTALSAILGGRKGILKKDNLKRWALVNF